MLGCLQTPHTKREEKTTKINISTSLFGFDFHHFFFLLLNPLPIPLEKLHLKQNPTCSTGEV